MNASPFSKREVQQILLPLAKKLIALQRPGTTLIVGIQGGQGTGKTTLAIWLKEYLHALGFGVQEFSIDDFYTSWKDRRILAQKYPTNPFYQIPRGLPGTHRVNDLHKTLQQFKAGTTVILPIFDKSVHHGAGDIGRKTISVAGRQDFVFLEGWCVGIPTLSSPKLQQVCQKNKINLKHLDPKLEYHKVVLHFIKNYQLLWKFLDYQIMLQPDAASLHRQWRSQQERELRAKTGTGMASIDIGHFVDPFLPFTYLCYDKIKPDVKILINKKHEFYKIVS